MRAAWVVALAMLSMAPLAAPVAVAESAAAEPSAHDLARRVQELERQNAELLRRLEQLERREQGTAATADATPPATDAEVEAAAAPADSATEGAGLGLGASYGPVRASFQVFGDAGFVYANPPETDSDEATFALGSVDLFTTAQIGEHFQALTEIVLEGDTEENEVHFELERLWGSWSVADALYLKLGREHSPMSRWNRRYHHGKWLWISATQPFVALFEDDGGPLAVHQVGLEAGGRVDVPIGALEYIGVLANGRGREPTEVPNFGDRNEAKAFDLALSFAPRSLAGLTVGGDFHADEIPDVPDDPSRERQIRELLGMVFIEYSRHSVEALGELVFIEHRDRTSGRTFQHGAGYLQLGYHLGQATPYLRFDGRDMERGDPFYAPEDIDLDAWEQVLGLRYDLNEFVALKLEGGLGRSQRRSDSGTTSRGGTSRVAGQVAWVF